MLARARFGTVATKGYDEEEARVTFFDDDALA
jgi:hypothetical protein